MADAAQPPVLTSRDGAVLTITLNRPAVRNALNSEPLSALYQALTDAAIDDEVRCVVLTGAGQSFCSGQDLGALLDAVRADKPSPIGPLYREFYIPVILAIRTIEKPVIAALNGAASGAGASIALACDLRIAADDAALIESFVRVGLIPGSGGTFLLPLLVGLGRAAEMVFTGKTVTADEALHLGLLNRIVPRAELETATAAWAAELATLPTRSMGLTKRGFNRAYMENLQEMLEYEAQLLEEASYTHDHVEGMRAFLEKRKPEFTGR